MRTVIFFCFICLVSTGALLAGIDMKNSGFGTLIAASAWLVLILYYSAKTKKQRYRKERERQFNDWFEQQYRRRSW